MGMNDELWLARTTGLNWELGLEFGDFMTGIGIGIRIGI